VVGAWKSVCTIAFSQSLPDEVNLLSACKEKARMIEEHPPHFKSPSFKPVHYIRFVSAKRNHLVFT
jgi:hypothetical protein